MTHLDLRRRLPVLLATIGMACASTGLRGNVGAHALAELSNARIFDTDHPIEGTRPSDVGISADGRFVSYRWAPTDSSRPAGPGPASRARFFVVSSKGGEAVDFGAPPTAIWSGVGSKLILTSGKNLQIWEGGVATNVKNILECGGNIGNVRLFPDGARALVTAGSEHWIVSVGGAQPAKRFEFAKDAPQDRIFILQNKIAAFGRNRRAESRPESAPASRPESSAASRPAEELYRCVLQDFEGNILENAEIHFAPSGLDLEQAVPSRDGLDWLFTFGERSRDRRSGFVVDYLSTKVTTRPARGSAAADPWNYQTLRGAHLRNEIPTSVFVRTDPPEEKSRQRFEIVANRDSSPGAPMFFVAKSDEDRKAKTIFAINDIEADGCVFTPNGAARLLDIPGPAGGVEFFAQGAGAPLFVSEVSGHARIYQYHNETKQLVSFSPENADVQWCQWGDGAGQEQQKVTIALVAPADAPWQRRFWRMFRSGSPHAPLPMPEMFASSASLSRDGSMLTFLGSALGESEDVYAMPADGSGSPKRLTFTAPSKDTIPGPAVPLKVVHYPAADGATIWAYCYEPPAGVARNGAAVIFLHGAGYLQHVRAGDGFPGYAVNHHFHRRLAAEGYVVLAPDFRGSAGYGRKFRTDVYQQLGIPDSQDIVDAKAWLAANESVDTERIGLYGGSYGGFLTLMCLFLHPREFACGAALRSVTDWRTYQPEYTRPLFGGGPEELKDPYFKTSPINYAEKLERPLLLLHGLVDDNVFAQDTIALVEKLQLLGKTDLFELMVYPSQNHTFDKSHSWIDEYTRIENFFGKHLLNNNKTN
ncbi:MAG: S9 family peptidase [Planctomycetes bacterium]|nr:S9 family peptidase [Planctomycetota bacterium]